MDGPRPDTYTSQPTSLMFPWATPKKQLSSGTYFRYNITQYCQRVSALSAQQWNDLMAKSYTIALEQAPGGRAWLASKGSLRA